jgi:hypothetical protein
MAGFTFFARNATLFGLGWWLRITNRYDYIGAQKTVSLLQSQGGWIYFCGLVCLKRTEMKLRRQNNN